MIVPDTTVTADTASINQARFDLELQIVGDLHRAGVNLLAGADSPNPYSIPGFGLHEELYLLTKAGLTPMEALQTATLNAALFLGRQDSLGTIENGKIASMVLLNKNPLEDIRHTRQIEGVFLRGSYLNGNVLGEMLEPPDQTNP